LKLAGSVRIDATNSPPRETVCVASEDDPERGVDRQPASERIATHAIVIAERRGSLVKNCLPGQKIARSELCGAVTAEQDFACKYAGSCVIAWISG
jgi:hypothetical protein